jgi:hypothetical protein
MQPAAAQAGDGPHRPDLPRLGRANITIRQGDAQDAASVDAAMPELDFVLFSTGSYPSLTLRGLQLPILDIISRGVVALLSFIKQR